ncbi:MAG: FAD:protein FMN transferase [Hyphomicrobiales bacterium]|nr:FAD:protein FMN transferase [Hyphomicrobiales bacterium]
MASILSRREILRGMKNIALATPLAGLVGCDEEDSWRPMTTTTGPTMGTGYGVKITKFPADMDRGGLRSAIEHRLEVINQQMSHWRVDSEISLFNAGRSSSWAGVSDDTFTVIDESLRVGRLSGGAFDPTVGSLVDLWGFGPGSGGRQIPPSGKIQESLGRIGFRHIRTRKAPAAIAKRRSDIAINLSGIAKGFAVDKLAEYLDEQGVAHYLVDIGGELRARGLSPRRRPWRIGVERPVAGPRTIQRIVALDGVAIATSGNYRIFFEHDSALYSHIIDPRSGEPVRHKLASVTVINPSTMRADALSTALMVLGPDAGYGLALREEIAALFIVKDGKGFAELSSPAFEQYLIG